MKRKFKKRWKGISTNHKLMFLGVFSILFLTVGYASLNRLFEIKGTSTVEYQSGVMFTKVETTTALSGSVDYGPFITNPTTFSANVSFPNTANGVLVFSVTVQNYSDVPATLLSIDGFDHFNTTDPTCITARISGQKVGDVLAAGESKKITITVLGGSSCSAATTSKSINFQFHYKLKDSSGGDTSLGNAVVYLTENKVEDTVESGGSGLVKVDNKGLITTSTTPREYRYIGPNPDNYISLGTSENDVYAYSFEQNLGNSNMKVTFSTLEECKMDANYSSDVVKDCYEEKVLSAGEALNFRIIGIFDGKLKIIAKDSIGNFLWNRLNNNWESAELQYFLNDLYLENIDQGRISEHVWNLGGSRTYNDVTAQMYYDRERSTDVYSSNVVTWTGKIGLMYPSDYGFATSGGTLMNRNTCLSTAIYSWEKTNAINCKDNDWLLDKSNIQWTMTPSAAYNNLLCHIGRSGWVSYIGGTSNLLYAIRPTMYLNSDVEFLSGTGTEIDPYILG